MWRLVPGFSLRFTFRSEYGETVKLQARCRTGQTQHSFYFSWGGPASSIDHTTSVGSVASLASQSFTPYVSKSLSASPPLLVPWPVADGLAASIPRPEMNCTLSQSVASCGEARQNSPDAATTPKGGLGARAYQKCV